MKASRFEIGLILFCAVIPAQAFFISKVEIDGDEVEYTTGSEARTDMTPDSSTVGINLYENFILSRWELRIFEYNTGDENLKPGLDVTAGSEISVELFTFPVGNAEYGRSYYINGESLTKFDYDPVINMVKVKFKPTAPALSASYAGGWTASAGMNINFKGTYQNPSEIMYGPPVIVGNFLADDASKGMHPSSSNLMGAMHNFAGIDGELGSFEYYLGSRHAAYEGYDLYNAEAYVDGIQPMYNFSWSQSIPSFTFDLGPTEDIRQYIVLNYNWSAHDIQVGQFPQAPAFTHISAQPGGIQMYWDADTNKSFTLVSYPALGGPTNVVATNLTALGFLDSGVTQTSRFYRLLQE